MRVVPEECLPTLRRRLTLYHVFRDRRLRDLKAERQQLAMDPRCSPLRVFLAHPSDEIAQLSIDLRPPCWLPRFPTPECRETRTMPAKDGLRLNDMRRTEQAWLEPGQPHHRAGHCRVVEGEVAHAARRRPAHRPPRRRHLNQTADVAQADGRWQASRRMML